MTEIERKFRVEHLPHGRSEPVRVEQAYIALDGSVEVRVRRRDGACSLTVKGGAGIERSEIELPLGDSEVECLWSLAAGRTIDKRRSTLPIGEHTAEIDEYDGRLRGLSVVEVEFESPAAADDFDPPDWFGAEITGDDRWSNARLATNGCPPD
ncbi:MAG: CYTH domain-containing protein [Ilumatobacter sp.]